MKRLLLIIVLFANSTYGQLNTGPNVNTVDNIISKPLHDPPLVINAYTEILGLDICKNEITVMEPSFYGVSDTIMIIQMKGAVIDTSNTAAFGTIIDYKNAGNYEMNYVSAIIGNKITLKNMLTRQYDVPDGVVQLIRVPYIKKTNHNGEYTCMPWDGTKGGVLVLNGQTVNLLDDIVVTGGGFRSGEFLNSTSSVCFENKYSYPASNGAAAQKGESIASLSQNISSGKGSPAAGGGGGLAHNSGGGGGGNAGMGGFGGYQSDSCGNATFDNRGIGGKNLTYSSSINKIFLGSGGGAGHAEEVSSGAFFDGRGGGIAIIIANTLNSNTLSIISDGGDGRICNIANCNDGMGGAGAGGTVLLFVNQITDNVSIETKGGKGADVYGSIIPGGRTGPGGGGGGGVFFLNRNALPGNVSVVNTGGSNGVIIADANNPWGATSGTDGLTLLDLPNPFDNTLFKPNIDSVRINFTKVNCNNFDFKGLGYTNTNPVQSWYWNFGDGKIASTQDASHTYTIQGTFIVKLIITDMNGCKDSTTIPVNPAIVTADAGSDQSFCSNASVTTTLNGNGTGSFAWTPSAFLNNSTAQNPVATINSTTSFYLTVTSNSCTATDSVKIIISPVPALNVSSSNNINCILPYTRLNVSGALQYLWSPASSLNNAAIANPIANPSSTTTYTVIGTNNNNCSSTKTITVNVDYSLNNIQLPNSFTPNGDGKNDCFGLKYYRDMQNLSFKIYNRYGAVIFETSDPAACWDGTYQGKPANNGNYVYAISAKTLCGDITRNGNVLLIR